MYTKLQYISQGTTANEQFDNIYRSLDNGCEWVQLRFKDAAEYELNDLAEKIRLLCDEYLATLIINDHVELASRIDADGIHLGLNDAKISDARDILGRDKIIGGTANTFEDVLQRIQEKCDYVGLGPFRFTETKSNLSPILGLEGYLNIIEKMRAKNIAIPIYAIGGIQLDDIENLMNIGIHGIAVSGLITQQPEIITPLNEKLYASI
ncbi:MAG: thiamine phosphate synthase [Flavobacterium sp.]